jgi:5'-nucleotidase
MQLKIICDMDDVLADFTQQICNAWNNEFNEKENSYWTTPRRTRSFIDAQMAKPRFFYYLEPIKNAISCMDCLLRDKSLEIFIATKIFPSSVYAFVDKLEWIERYLPNFNKNNFFACSRKEMIKGDVLIDDCPDNIKSWKRIGLLFDSPCNQDFQLGYRVKSWIEILNKIEQIKDDIWE